MTLRAAFDAWLFRLTGPEPGRIVLGQRRVFLLPTRAGMAFGLALAPMLLASVNYNLSLGYLITFLLGGLGIVAILHGFRNLVGLAILPGKAEPVFAGSQAAFGLILANDRDQPRPALDARLQEGSAVVLDLGGNEQKSVCLMRHAPHRGWLRPGRVRLETRYPLGLIRAWSYVEPDMRCLVYPRPETDPPPLPLGGREGAAGARSGEGVEDFLGLRPYRPPDSPRRIAWKSLSGGGELLAKQFSGTEDAVPWLDWRMLPPGLDQEAKLSRLAAWLVQARRLGLPCGLSLPGFERPPAADDGHFLACLRALAEYGAPEG
ncbi:MAG: DUF58 domain-containing protein [Rhodocyclaceae bacterium]|nr:DUF58 domain-containing protein [Rhodocyclaceae bacterium]